MELRSDLPGLPCAGLRPGAAGGMTRPESEGLRNTRAKGRRSGSQPKQPGRKRCILPSSATLSQADPQRIGGGPLTLGKANHFTEC